MMKKITYFATTLALLTAVSCMNEKMESPAPEAQNSDNYVEFTAEIPSTKTSLSNDGKNNVLWNPGDEIAVYDTKDQTGHRFITNLETDSASARFCGTASPFINKVYFAAYPYSAVISWKDKSTPTFDLPGLQTACKNSFPKGLNYTVSNTTSDEMSFKFRNILSYIKFEVVDDNVLLFQIISNRVYGDSYISGAFEYNIMAQKDNMQNITDKGKTVVNMNTGTIGKTIEPGIYYIAVRPGKYTGGLTINVKNSAFKTATILKTGAKEIKPGVIYNIGKLENMRFE